MICANEYGLYSVPDSSVHTSPAAIKVANGEVCEPDTIQYILDHCGTEDIVHAGAYFGDFIPALAKGTNKTVWAFEPKYEHYLCCKETITLNNLRNVELIHAALSSRRGMTKLWIKMPDGRVYGAGSRVDESQPDDLTEPVPCTTLDHVLPYTRPISLIHLDIEGSEQAALEGGMEIIKRWRPILILETIPPPTWTRANLTPLGYRPVKKVGHLNTVFRCR